MIKEILNFTRFGGKDCMPRPITVEKIKIRYLPSTFAKTAVCIRVHPAASPLTLGYWRAFHKMMMQITVLPQKLARIIITAPIHTKWKQWVW
jgi:hypothetical protein